MRSGALGEVVFYTSNIEIKTFQSWSFTRSIRQGEHNVIQGKPLLQHTGRELDIIELPILVRSFLPYVYPATKQFEKFLEMAEQGEAYPLVLGNSYKGLFVITAVKCTAKSVHGNTIVSMDLTLSLKEYVQ